MLATMRESKCEDRCWQKTCPSCARTYRVDEWARLRYVGSLGDLEMRDCVGCGSCLGVETMLVGREELFAGAGVDLAWTSTTASFAENNQGLDELPTIVALRIGAGRFEDGGGASPLYVITREPKR